MSTDTKFPENRDLAAVEANRQSAAPTASANHFAMWISKAARAAHPKHQNAPVSVKREMKAQPFGFFGLMQTWATQNRGDYTLLPLLPEEHSLSTGRSRGGHWYLTPNGNQTSATLAAAAASSGLKTLVFVQTIPLAEASARDFHRLLDAPTVSAFFSESSRPPRANASLAAPPASNWSRRSFGIAGSLRRDIWGLLFTHYARPHTEILTVPSISMRSRPAPSYAAA